MQHILKTQSLCTERLEMFLMFPINFFLLPVWGFVPARLSHYMGKLNLLFGFQVFPYDGLLA